MIGMITVVGITPLRINISREFHVLKFRSHFPSSPWWLPGFQTLKASRASCLPRVAPLPSRRGRLRRRPSLARSLSPRRRAKRRRKREAKPSVCGSGELLRSGPTQLVEFIFEHTMFGVQSGYIRARKQGTFGYIRDRICTRGCGRGHSRPAFWL